MRTLKYVILGLLMNKPMSGYDIYKEFEEALVEFWSAKHSQIYPELKKLVKEGLIEYETQVTEGKMVKKLYSITEEGKKDFIIWLNSDVPMESTPKDVFRLRMYFSKNINKEHMIELLESQLVQHKERRQYLIKSTIKFEEKPQPGTDSFGDYIVLQGAILREKSYIDWLELALSYYKER